MTDYLILFKSCVAFRDYSALHDLAENENIQFIVYSPDGSSPAGSIYSVSSDDIRLEFRWQDYVLHIWPVCEETNDG